MDYSLVFDVNYYADHYADLQNSFGDDETKLFNHFLKHGMSEGRRANNLFDVEYYRGAYPDLEAAFQGDLRKYYQHFMEHGYFEGRFGNKADAEFSDIYEYEHVNYSPVYQAAFYRKNYPDLEAAFGDNKEKYLEHFVKHGMAEKRVASPRFNVNYYMSNYADLREAFGPVTVDYFKHYIRFGSKENRIAYKLLGTPWFSSYHSGDGDSIYLYVEKVSDVNVYAAHLLYSHYNKLKTIYDPIATASELAKKTDAIFCVNGSAARINGSGEMHDGEIPDFSKDKYCTPGLYSQKTGILMQGWGTDLQNKKLSQIREDGIATDTLGFGKALLINATPQVKEGGTRRPRTFIGTNGHPGDLWIVVSEGDGINGGGSGLTSYECMDYLRNRGCVLAYPLDGGGSSTMVFAGAVVNTPSEKGVERGYIGDFIYFK